MKMNDDSDESDSDVFSSAQSGLDEQPQQAWTGEENGDDELHTAWDQDGERSSLVPRSLFIDSLVMLLLLQRGGIWSSILSLVASIHETIVFPPSMSILSIAWWTVAPAAGQPSMVITAIVDMFVASFFYSIPRIRGFVLNLGLATVSTQVCGGGVYSAVLLAITVTLAQLILKYIPLLLPNINIDYFKNSPTDGWLAVVLHLLTLQVVGHSLMLSARQFMLSYGDDSAASSQTSSAAKKDTEASAGQTAAKKKKQADSGKGEQPIWRIMAEALVSWHLREVESSQKSQTEQYLSAEDQFFVSSLDSTEATLTWFPPDVESIDFRKIQIRVNGIVWPQTSLQQDSQKLSLPGPVCYLLVFGLTPATEYDIEIYHIAKRDVLCSTIVCTSVRQVDDDRDVAQSRPISPVSFLRDTLSTAKDNLNECRSRQKRTKKDHSKHLSSQRAEIDSLKTKVGTGDKSDERVYRRILYLRGFVKRAQEESESMDNERTALIETQEANEEEWHLKKEEWQAVEAHLKAAEKIAEEHKTEYDERMANVQAEKSSYLARKEKIISRKVKLEHELENAIRERDDVGAQQREEARQRREELARRRKRIESEFSVNIGKMERAIIDRQQRTQATRQAVEAQKSSAMKDLRKSTSSSTS